MAEAIPVPSLTFTSFTFTVNEKKGYKIEIKGRDTLLIIAGAGIIIAGIGAGRKLREPLATTDPRLICLPSYRLLDSKCGPGCPSYQ